MMRRLTRGQLRAGASALAIGAGLVAFRSVALALAIQLAAAYLLMALALPLCRRLEEHLTSSTAAAALSFAALTLGAAAILLLVIPLLARQFRQLSDSVPALIAWGAEQLSRLEKVLNEQGISVAPVRDQAMEYLQRGAAALVSAAADRAAFLAKAAGRLFLAPLFAFYLLRDRRMIARNLTLLLPVSQRASAVRACREMRREASGFVRAQLLISAFVGALTAMGLLLVGTPGWLLLGLLMGVLEMVPYIGPLAAGTPAVLLALQLGMDKALWTLAVLFAVQQLEGTLLAPRLMSGATRLHPLAVLLAISAGGLIGGAWGMLLSLPVVVSVRGALRALRA